MRPVREDDRRDGSASDYLLRDVAGIAAIDRARDREPGPPKHRPLPIHGSPLYLRNKPGLGGPFGISVSIGNCLISDPICP
jgi:hypothetical protein